MRKKIIFFIIFFPILFTAQTIDSLKPKKFAIGINYSPDYCYQILNKSTTNNPIELPKYGYTAGITFLSNLGKHISLETGLFISDKGRNSINNLSYYLAPDGSAQVFSFAKIDHHYYYVDIPVKVNFNILSKRLKLYISIGAATDVFLRIKSVSHISDINGNTKTTVYTNNSISSVSRLNFSGILGIGISYDLTKRWGLKIEPTYRQYLIPITDFNVKKYFYSIGANVGVSYRF